MKITSWIQFLSIGILCVFPALCRAQNDPFAPDATDFAVWGPTCPNDALMPSVDEKAAVREWEQAVFAGQKSFEPNGKAALELLQQDFNLLRFNESCMGNPLNIGGKMFETGLGTHANSRIVARFPEKVSKFQAFVGIDLNSHTQDGRGSVIFSVMANGKKVFESPVCRGKEEAVPVDVTFEEPVSEILLEVNTTEDGPCCDQSDWCEAVGITESGTVYSLSDKKSPLLGENGYPFSFVYGGKLSDELLPNWTFESREIDLLHSVYSWTDQETGLKVEAFTRRFEQFAAIEWMLNFTNTGNADTPMLEQVKSARAGFALGLEEHPVVIHTLRGDFCDESSWLPQEFPLAGNEEKSFAPTGGRPSNLVMPFWNIARNSVTNREPNEGVFITLGWSGQWKADYKRASDIQLNFSAGQEDLASILHAGETIRTPRVLVMPWHGCRIDSHALFRRLLMFEYAPKWANAPAEKALPQPLEFFGQCFDRYYRKRPGWEKQDAQVEFARRLAEAGCTSYWFDAAWFPVGFPNGVGNWFGDQENFPEGMEALGKAVHDLGLKFTLWFEPERVAPGTDIAVNHSEYTLGDPAGNRLYNLADPEAEKYLTDLLSKRIEEYGINIYRNDFNIDPLIFWRAADEPNRKGITEIRYIEAHYRMWDTLITRHPGLWIDNCASGGRRIDLETISRSISLWRSDTCCWPGHPEWDQIQSLSIVQYVPIFASVAWDPSPYTFRSAACPGAILQYNFLDDDYDPEMTKKSIQEAKVYQKFWYGDLYPLSDAALGKQSIIAWQLNRSDLNAGVVYVFRQSESPYLGRDLGLRGLDSEGTYQVRFKSDYGPGEVKTMTGKELAEYPMLIPEAKSAIVVEYQKVR